MISILILKKMVKCISRDLLTVASEGAPFFLVIVALGMMSFFVYFALVCPLGFVIFWAVVFVLGTVYLLLYYLVCKYRCAVNLLEKGD
ncbi:MAG: hypothetical protein LBE57_04795 [Methanosarcinales archaeon]|jgi:hypothetical protein|nr:hypothetical protein [Methanosarcinales archaeon]